MGDLVRTGDRRGLLRAGVVLSRGTGAVAMYDEQRAASVAPARADVTDLELRRACGLVAHAGGAIPAVEIFVGLGGAGDAPDGAAWVAARRRAGELAQTYGVAVAIARVADGVLYRVTPRAR